MRLNGPDGGDAAQLARLEMQYLRRRGYSLRGSASRRCEESEEVLPGRIISFLTHRGVSIWRKRRRHQGSDHESLRRAAVQNL